MSGNASIAVEQQANDVIPWLDWQERTSVERSLCAQGQESSTVDGAVSAAAAIASADLAQHRSTASRAILFRILVAHESHESK